MSLKNSQSLLPSLNSNDIITSPSNHSSSPISNRNLSPPSFTSQVPSPITSSVITGASMSYQKSQSFLKSNQKNFFVVPNFLSTSSGTPSVITSSGNGTLSHHMHQMPHNYSHALNNHLYHSSQIMSPGPTFSSNSPKSSPNYFYDIPTAPSLNNLMSSTSPLLEHSQHNGTIKLENITPHIFQSTSNRQDSYDEDLDKSKILEQKHVIASLSN